MKKVLLFFVLILGAIIVNAQSYYQVQAGLSFPNGDFVDDNTDIDYGSGNASTGINAGIKYFSPLDIDRLSWVVAMNIHFNPLSSDYKDDVEDADVNLDYKFAKYINIPALTGLNYRVSIDEDIELFGEGLLGINMLKITNSSFEGDNTELTMKFSPSFKFGFSIGGGVNLNNKYSIGLNYYSLGSHKCKYEVDAFYYDEHESYDSKFNRSMDIGIVSLTLGVKL